MSDEFLYRLRKEPRPEFAAQLYARIDRPRRRSMLSGLAPRRLALAGAVAVLCAMLLASPAARAELARAVRMIGGIGFEESDTAPPAQQPVELLSEQTVPIDEASAMLPEPIPIPAWAPPGYALQSYATLTPPTDNLRFTWAQLAYRADESNGPRTPIYFKVWYPADADGRLSWTVGTDAVEEVSINGRPAALVRGAHEVESGIYGARDMLSLKWERDGRYFTLDSSDTAVAPEELIRMAESIP